MIAPPVSIKAHKSEAIFEILWEDASASRLPFKFLRGRCPCAACVNEHTGERTFDIDQVEDDIMPVALAHSGNYALKISWSDGHKTGLYTWEYLQQLDQELTAAIRSQQ